MLLASYTGLVLGPSIMTGLASFGSLAAGDAVLGALSAAGGLLLLRCRKAA